MVVETVITLLGNAKGVDIVCTIWKHIEVHKRTAMEVASHSEHIGARDEINTHAPIFANIFKILNREEKIPAKTIDKVYEMINEGVEIEKRYSHYLTDNYPILGLNRNVVDATIENFVNDRLRAIGLETIYPEREATILENLIDRNIKKINDKKQNFFEVDVTNYSKNSVNMDDF